MIQETFNLARIKELATMSNLNAEEFFLAMLHIICRSKATAINICQEVKVKFSRHQAMVAIHEMLFAPLGFKFGHYCSYI